MGKVKKLSKEKIDDIFEKFGTERGTIMAGEIREIEVGKLKPHPKNESIYGQEEDVSDLVALIKGRGKIIEPLKITEDFVIISGHRRWKAAQTEELNYKTVPCEFVSYDNEEEELADLILFNADREKTLEQKAREGIALFETLSSEAFLRRMAALKQNQTDMDDSSTSGDRADDEGVKHGDTGNDSSSEKGLTRDKVARAVGLSSGKTFDRMKAVLEKADALKSEDNTDDSELFVAVLNRSPSAAHDLLKVDLGSLSDEDREKIKAGKVAPRAFIREDKPTKTTSSNKKSSQMDKIKGEIETLNSTIRGLKKPVSRTKDDYAEEICRELDETISDLYELRTSVYRMDELDLYRLKNNDFISTVSALIKTLPGSYGSFLLEECKEYVEEDIAILQKLLAVIETDLKMEKGKDH